MRPERLSAERHGVAWEEYLRTSFLSLEKALAWDEHYRPERWDEQFKGVLLTSEVGRRPTERLKLTLGQPANQDRRHN